jgi:ATP-dependent Lon protease
MAKTETLLDNIVIPKELAVLPLRKMVVFPGEINPITVGRPSSIKLIDEASMSTKIIAVTAQLDPVLENPTKKDLYKIGTAINISRMLKLPNNSIQILVQGITRISIEDFVQEDPYFKAVVRQIVIPEQRSDEIEALVRSILGILEKLTNISTLGNELYVMGLNIKDPSVLADLIASALNLPFEEQQEFLETFDVKKRLEKVNLLLNKELQLSEISSKIQSDIKEKLDKTQREFVLRQELEAIKKELGEDSGEGKEVKDLKEKLEKAGMPEDVYKEVTKELDRMAKIPPVSPEYTIINTYLELIVSLPWSTMTEDNLDINNAKTILDEDHHDLEKIKDRILEFLAVRKLKKDGRGPILCFVGPPGVGKTSLGKSIARAMGRKFVRISLGGIRDEADIRGHRRTYIGALPGRILDGIQRAGSKNPVFMLDEIDKIGIDFRGDPASALLEVLDPEQNNSFTDHYLNLPFDLSNVLFISTANIMDTIPPPLLDRMEVLLLPGYTEEEKLIIAKKFLVPRQLKENGLEADNLELPDAAIMQVVRDYTREAGLRNLERELGTICRKSAVDIVNGKVKKVLVTKENLSDFLGPFKFYSEIAERIKQPGVAIGLAWTQAGGDILFIEATKMPGKKELILTGQLGNVMKESAQAALSYVRSKSKELSIPEDFFEKNDIHIHIPAGAIPKDGPSAGVTLGIALVSLLTNKTIVPFLAMTGEITLRGNILPVGGIKEKILAARRAGIKKVLLPKRNEQDLKEIYDKIKNDIEVVFIETIDDAIREAIK